MIEKYLDKLGFGDHFFYIQQQSHDPGKKELIRWTSLNLKFSLRKTM